MSALHRTNGLLPDRPRAPLHDFSPAAIMARARTFAAESAARWAARHAAAKLAPASDPRSPDDLLEDIRITIADQLGAPLSPIASALARRQAIFGAFDGEATHD